MTKRIGVGLLALGILLSFFVYSNSTPVQAAELTEQQIQAVVSLIASFGANAETVASATAALRGQATSVSSSTSISAECLELSRNLGLGNTDTSTDGEVSALQKFLGITPPTGYFGPLTMAAVEAWQSANGIVSSGTPQTTGYGRVGPATRQAMACGTTDNNVAGQDDDLFLEDILLDDIYYDEEATATPAGGSLAAAAELTNVDEGSGLLLGQIITSPKAGTYRTDKPLTITWKIPTNPATARNIDVGPRTVCIRIQKQGSSTTYIPKLGTSIVAGEWCEAYSNSKRSHAWTPNTTTSLTPGTYRVLLNIYYLTQKEGGSAGQRQIIILGKNIQTSSGAWFELTNWTTSPLPSCTFSTAPDSITAGNTSTLSWTATNATTGTIDHSVGAMTPIAAGSKSVSPTSSTLYTATVTGAGVGASATCEANVDVTTGTGDTTKPTVSLTAPAASSTVSSTVTISANAFDPSTGSGQVSGVAGVQFKVDGANVGAEDTTAPYSISWDSTSITNGTHYIRAVAKDAAGNTRWSAVRSVTVSNTTTIAPISLILDPTYQSGPSVRTPESVLSFTTSNLYPFGNDGSKTWWTISQWGAKYPLSSTTPKTVLANGAVEYKTLGLRVVLGPGNYALLGVNEVGHGTHIQRLGTVSKSEGFIALEPKSNPANNIPISQLASVQYKMSFRLVKAQAVKPVPASEAAQASANLRFTNRNPSSPGYGEWVYFIIKLYDNRNRTIDYNIKKDGGTGSLLYRLPSSDFYGNKSAWDKQWITIDKDILPMFAKAIQVGYSKGYLKSSDLGDYFVSFNGPHWEGAAPMDVEMEFKDFDVILTPKPAVVVAPPSRSFFGSVWTYLTGTIGAAAAALFNFPF